MGHSPDLADCGTPPRDTLRRIAGHIERLADPDLKVSARAEGRLIRFGSKAIPQLLAAAESPDPQVRFRAAWALGQTGDPRAMEVLLRLTDDPDERVRYDATVALGELGDERASGPLILIWLADDVSRPGAMALSRLGPCALPAIEEVLESATLEDRRTAVSIIGEFAERCGDRRSMELLREMEADSDSIVREEARYWLNEAGCAGTTDGKT